jgi:hypothetical protein
MADISEAIAADLVLGPREKEARRSAINTLCTKWLRKEPETVQADYRLIQRELARLNPVLCGVSKGRFANVKSLINRSFLAVRRDLIDTHKTSLAPEWVDLFAAAGEPALKHVARQSG